MRMRRSLILVLVVALALPGVWPVAPPPMMTMSAVAAMVLLLLAPGEAT